MCLLCFSRASLYSRAHQFVSHIRINAAPFSQLDHIPFYNPLISERGILSHRSPYGHAFLPANLYHIVTEIYTSLTNPENGSGNNSLLRILCD